MDKDLIKFLIADYQQRVVNVTSHPREYQLDDNLNYVFVGLRRAGKSYMMFRQIEHLIEIGHRAEEILYFNFEDDRIDSVSTLDLDLIKTCYEEMYDCQPIFFLDEIQLVDKWEKFARRLADQKYRVYITGSNAKMLSSEISTTLGGRYMMKEIYPYSFHEFLNASGIDMGDSNAIYKNKTNIAKAFESYFYFGGLPEISEVKDKRSWLSNLYNKIFFGDLIARFQIRNDFALRVLVKKLAESVKQPSSYNRLKNVISTTGKKVSADTIIDYIRYMKDSWLILPFENIDSALSERESNKKYYFIDNGILNLFLLDPNTSLLENMVAIELRKKYGNRVYYYNKKVEVDFYIPDEECAIQVCYSLKDAETRQREASALTKLADRLPVKDMMIITKDEEDVIPLDDHHIVVMPLWKWLLNKMDKGAIVNELT
jgi:predicted AAA+ superfamily ATPase